jgi:prepilin-type N-terminal cleavage/methylation domain-containing protein
VKARGFSVLEVILAVAVIGVLSATIMGGYVGYLNQAQKEETKVRLKQLKQALEEAYRRELLTVSVAGTSGVVFGGVTIANNVDASAALLQPLQGYASLNAAVMANDGFNQPMRFFVSDELAQPVGGATLRYRVIAVVAPGHNMRVDSTFDQATGALTAAGDDYAEVVNGYGVVRAVYDDTQQRIERLVTSYQNYFLTRFLANPTRSMAVDYFANTDPAGGVSPNWDDAGAIASSRGVAADAESTSMRDALGLSPADVTTSFGQPILVDNSSNDVNHPNHPQPNRALPPYTARVIAPLPSGEQLVRTVSGLYN